MRLLIDRDACTGHGRCYSLGPALIAEDDEGFPVLRGEPIPVPAGQEELAEEIEGTCPEGAIELLADA